MSDRVVGVFASSGQRTDRSQSRNNPLRIERKIGSVRRRVGRARPANLGSSSGSIIPTAETVTRAGAQVVGPVPLPTEKNVVAVIRSPHKYKDSREHFEMRTHKRVIDIIDPTPKAVDSLMRLDLPADVNIEIKL